MNFNLNKMEQQTKHTPEEKKLTFCDKCGEMIVKGSSHECPQKDDGKITLNIANEAMKYIPPHLERGTETLIFVGGFVTGYKKAPTTAAERDSLKQWKEEATELFGKWNKVDEYIRNHSEVKLGAFITDEALRFIQERDKLREEVERLKADLKYQEESFCSMTSNRTAFKFWKEKELELSKLKEENERLTKDLLQETGKCMKYQQQIEEKSHERN